MQTVEHYIIWGRLGLDGSRITERNTIRILFRYIRKNGYSNKPVAEK